ncbi:cytochrome b [Vibrio cholerae]|uniref:cytochrome b/b6 domain-containing protein n=1 Tax=Vibrio cholerae TaxID=666 RepID=UPI000893D39B|nr:cytochrome b/b6 domain-containing protein [Vibrio cholerae]EGR2589576.1 cytochrome b [Vibrio cholerae]EKG0008975.1 cytochrome b/b6 domain-containing protein [Vibrio cholerae]OFI74203.1 cytochrome B [Vibrio cholerae]
MAKPYTWDLFVRVTHWLVAALFLANFFAIEEGSDLHEWVGYVVMGAIILRLGWGVITHSPARLTAFTPSIPKAIEHIKEVVRTKQDNHTGHNPAGAIMIWAMWFLLLATGLSGWMSEWDLFWGEDWIKEVHETLANLTIAAVAVHVSAVIIMSKFTGHPYVHGMLSGHKTSSQNSEQS